MLAIRVIRFDSDSDFVMDLAIDFETASEIAFVQTLLPTQMQVALLRPLPTCD
jgi:hypothetical protein